MSGLPAQSQTLPPFSPSVFPLLLIRRRVAGGERLHRSFLHSPGVGPRLRRGGAVAGRRSARAFCRSPQQLPQHVLQDSAVLVVQHLLRGIDSDGRPRSERRCRRLCGRSPPSVRPAANAVSIAWARPSRVEHFTSSEPQDCSTDCPGVNCSGRIPMPTRFDRWIRS